MTACLCASCTPKPAQNYGEPHRYETELRHVLALPSREDRQRYLAGVKLRRGPDAYDRIVTELRSMATRRAA